MLKFTEPVPLVKEKTKRVFNYPASHKEYAVPQNCGAICPHLPEADFNTW